MNQVFMQAEKIGPLWGRLVTCGGLLIRLRDAAASGPVLAGSSTCADRRIANPQQVTNLPHNQKV
jgi:hypothetical protein